MKTNLPRTELIACPVCARTDSIPRLDGAGDRLHRLREGEFRYVECPGCGLEVAGADLSGTAVQAARSAYGLPCTRKDP